MKPSKAARRYVDRYPKVDHGWPESRRAAICRAYDAGRRAERAKGRKRK